MSNTVKSRELIFGLTFEQISNLQQRKNIRNKIGSSDNADYGADPTGHGTFRMVPSGDIVDYEERNRRLSKFETR